ncbi:trypsin-like serine peptidase [Kutzneria sp. CA-103260]|uniref:trypsin-like serine peptidase n=1 Tax=Kutzneria sp. CA-103260 TaxID=2802641 RepID=UPI001BAC81CF|nr:trypsin-like peptidase domain-containing protein [Kutzneria sp. CA-103260]QUQ65799.1 serine protease [Kutzneria sp. CA-103260]
MRRMLTLVAVLVLMAVYAATASGAARSWSTPIGVIAPNNLGVGHYCSASVVASPRHNVVLTAAHCVWDTDPATKAVWFLPSFNNGAASTYGRWRVVKIIVPPQYLQWRKTHPAPAGQDRTNPYDYAFLIVDGDVQGRTGALTPVVNAVGGPTTVAGYNDTGGSLSSCRSTANRWEYQGNWYLKVACPSVSLSSGTSGGPFVETGTNRVIGVMGGYQEGGPTPYTDYSSAFQADFTAAYDLAKRG